MEPTASRLRRRLAVIATCWLASTTVLFAATPCAEFAAWIDSALDDGRIPVRRAAMVWTGSEALIWGGEIGYGFDPLTSSWRIISSAGAPGGYGPVSAWTGSELLVWGGTLSSGTTEVDTGGARYDPALDTWSAVTTTGAPAGRRDAASAWSGSEWVVWGGRDSAGTALADGARYDPLADGWTPTNATGAPAARYAHSMTWTGGEVLVFGGRSGGTYFADLIAYDPLANDWTALGAPPGEAGREGHAAVWTGSELIVYGGQQSGVGAVNTGWRYDPAIPQWTAMSTTGAPAPGTTTRAVWTGSELIVWSGSGAASGRYDPVTDSWSPVTPTGAPSSRSLHSIAWLGDRLMVWGGGIADGATYDVASDQWTPTDPVLPTRPMRAHIAVWTGSEVLFWGGQSAANHAVASGYRYSPATDTWAPITSAGAPSSRVFAAGVWTGSELIVWGGQSSEAATTRLGDGARYDPATDSWTAITDIGAPEARTHHRAVWTGSEMVVWGGWVGTGRDLTDEGARYDPASDSWTPMTTIDAPPASRDQPMVWTGSKVIVWSGAIDVPPNQVTYDTAGAAYDPVIDSWTAIADSATAGVEGRGLAGVVWTGSEMLVWGGAGDPDTLDTGGRYDPVSDSWTATSTSGAPGDRRDHLAVWTGHEMLVYGGQSGDFRTTSAYLNDGGRYDPATDTWDSLPVEPDIGPRSLHAGAWTGDRVVAFGGLSDGGVHNAGGVLFFGADDDTDTVCDTVDNCLGVANPDQADFDADAAGDACDVCPRTPDPGQEDTDGDGVGDACERCSDPDGDGACDVPLTVNGDRCPIAYNPDQTGRKIVLSGSPFDGLEVTRSYLRKAGDDAPLVVFDGDLVTDGTPDLFTQRSLEGFTLTSLGVAAAVGPTGYMVEDVYDDRALFFDQDATVDLYGVALEGGAPPNRVDPLPPGYVISRRGTKVIFDWTTSDFPCEFVTFPTFAMVDTVTGAGTCFGTDFADQTIADWWISPDASWLTYLFQDFNSIVGARVYARSPDFDHEREIQNAPFPGDIGGAPAVEVRDDGLAIIHDYFVPPTVDCDTVALRVGGEVQQLPGPFDPCPTTRFSDQGDGALLLGITDIALGTTDLYVTSVSAANNDLVESDSVGSLDDSRFSPGESHFAFTSAGSTELYVSPAAAGGPVTQIATAGNTITGLGFTPDASTLLYAEQRTGDLAAELWKVPVGGGTPVRIGPVPQTGAPGVTEWTFDGGRLIVRGNFDGTTSQLYSMEPDGSDQRQIELPGANDSVAEFWTGFDGGVLLKVEGSSQLLLAPATGGKAEALTKPGDEDDVSAPQVAEDGSFLIYDARIAGSDRETVIYFAVPPDQDMDGILDPCDCLPADPSGGQSPGIVDLRFTDATTLDWDPDGVSTAWTVYRGDLALVPADDGSCIVEGHPTTSYTDPTPPSAAQTLIYLVAGEGACGTGEVGPRSDGSSRNVSCP